MEFLFSNFGDTQLSQVLAADDTTLHVAPSDTLRLPQPGADQVFALILSDGRNEPEILWCDGNPRTGALSVLRGQEGTPASFWDVGTPVIHTHTAAALEWFVTGGQVVWKAELQAQIDALVASVAALQSKDDDQDADLAAQLTTLSSSIEANTATISENWLATTDFFYASASITDTLSATVASDHADLVLLESTVASNESAQALFNVTLTTNTNNAATKAQLALDTANTTSSAQASFTTTVNARFSTNEARITNAETSIATNYSTQATSIASLSASYGGLSATVTTQATAIAGINGQLSASWSVTVGAGSNWAGLKLMTVGGGGATISQLRISVADFIVESPDLTSAAANIFSYNSISGWFEVSNLHVHGDLVVDGTITNPKIGPLAVNNPNVVRDSITTGVELVHTIGSPIAVFHGAGSGFTAPMTGFAYAAIGGRIKMNFQITVSNTTGPNEVALTVELYLNGSSYRTYVKKLPSAFPDTFIIVASAFVTPGATNSIEIWAGVDNTSVGSPSVSMSEVRLDIDDYSTES